MRRPVSFSVCCPWFGRAAEGPLEAQNERAVSRGTVAEEIGIAAPTRCGLGVAVDHARTLVVGVDDTGEPFTSLTTRTTGLTELVARDMVAPELLARVRTCEQLDVLARPPIAGQPGLLPPDLAWSYRVGQGHLRRDVPAVLVPPRRLVIADVLQPSRGSPSSAALKASSAAPARG